MKKKGRLKSQKSKDKGHFKKIQLAVAICLLLVAVLMLFKNPGITGHFSADFKSQTLSMAIDKSQSYMLTAVSQEPIYITSIRMSGEVVGNGNVEVFIDNNAGQRLLLYRNVKKIEQGLSTVTGMLVGSDEESIEASSEQRLLVLKPLDQIEYRGAEISLSAKEEYVSGSFNNKCADTCFIEMTLSSEIGYKLIFNIEPGTMLKINKLIYTLKDEMT